MKKRPWNRLDNAAKIFPPTSNVIDPKVFRCTCQLRENVHPVLLQEALDETMLLFPYFRSTIKKGFFWYYLEQTNLSPVVFEESKAPCGPIYAPDDHGLLFELSYFRKRINLEVYHALTDGTGGLQFLQQLVIIYLQKRYKQLEGQPYFADYISKQMTQDGYSKYYQKVRVQKKRSVRAHQIKSDRFSGFRFGLIECLFPAKQLLTLAKAHQVSVSVLLTSYLIESIHESMSTQDEARPIVISVPVNLRSYFPTESLRNFFGVITVSHHYPTQGRSFDEILQNVKEQFTRLLSPEAVQERMSLMTSIEKMPAAKILPLVIKTPSLRIGNSAYGKAITAGMSNLGEIKMPEQFLPYVELFEVASSTKKLDVCLCSHQGTMSITLISSLTNTEAQYGFVRRLTQAGIEMTVDSNLAELDWGNADAL